MQYFLFFVLLTTKKTKDITMSRGKIYIMTNDAMPGYIKIGRTTNTLEQRMKELDTTGVPVPFRCHYAVEVDDHEVKEKLIHDGFADHRVRQNREFFQLAPERAMAILKALGGQEVKIDNSMVDESGQVLVDTPQTERFVYKGKFTFKELEIPVGAELVFTRSFPDGIDRKCVVVDEERHVEYKGEVYTLSKLAMKLMRELGYNWPTNRGPAFFKYNDEIPSERRARMSNDSLDEDE